MALFNRTNPRFPMALEDDKAGGAGVSAPDPAENKPEENPVLAELKAMNQRLTQANEALAARLAPVEQFASQFSQALAAQQSRKAPANQEDPPEVDPDTQRFLEEKLRGVNRGQALVADELDALKFSGITAQAKVDPKDVEAALKLHANWQRNNVTFEGQPLSRLDALKFVLGHQKLTGASTDATNLPGTEEERREGNKHAITENGARGGNGPAPKDPEKMTRRVRIESYWSEVLDKEGF